MKQSFISILFCLSAFVSVSEARTSTIIIDRDAENVEYWDALQNYSSNGESELATMAANWTNQLAVRNGGSYAVSLYIDSNYSDKYPTPNETADNINFILSGNAINFTVKSGGVLGLRTNTAASDYVASTAQAYGQIQIQNASTFTVEGNGKVYANDLQMYSNDAAGTIIVKDQALFYTRGTTQIGQSSFTTAQTLRIEGSEIETVHLRNLRFTGGENTSAENVTGAKFEFIADANGITTIENESSIQVFSGIIEVDFTKLLWKEEWGDEHTFTLISATGNSVSVLSDWVLENEMNGLSILEGVSGGEFSYDNNNLYLTIAKDSLTIVPEPSTYAAIFGALALAFAAYRRRK